MKKCVAKLSVVLFISAFSSFISAGEPATPARFPLPEPAKIVEAEKLVNEVFKIEPRSASQSAEIPRVTAKMRLQASDTHDEPAVRYALLKKAFELSAGRGDAGAALLASDALVRLFEVNELNEMAAAINKLSPMVVAPEEHRNLVSGCLRYWDLALKQELYKDATQILSVAELSARESKDPQTLKTVQLRARDVRDLFAEFTRTENAKAKLKLDPYDAESNLALGRFTCFVKRDWDAGFKWFALSGDAKLKDLAAKEFLNPEEVKERIALADLWFDRVQTEKNESPFALAAQRSRAEFWYQKAGGTLKGGLLKAKVEARLDELKKPKSEPASTPPTTVFPTRRSVDVLALIDPAKDKIAGEWSRNDGALTSSKEFASRVAIPYQPPAEYDFKIVFVSTTPPPMQVCQILSANGRGFSWIMGANKGQFFGFEMIAGADVSKNPTSQKPKSGLQSGHRYTSVVEVRAGHVRALLDGQLIAEWKTDYKDMSMVDNWKLHDEKSLGLGAHNCGVTFISAEVTEINGRGTVLREANK